MKLIRSLINYINYKANENVRRKENDNVLLCEIDEYCHQQHNLLSDIEHITLTSEKEDDIAKLKLDNYGTKIDLISIVNSNFIDALNAPMPLNKHLLIEIINVCESNFEDIDEYQSKMLELLQEKLELNNELQQILEASQNDDDKQPIVDRLNGIASEQLILNERVEVCSSMIKELSAKLSM